jgi:hypothetical protein
MFGLKSFRGFFCCFETDMVLKIKDLLDRQSVGEPFGIEYASCDEFVPQSGQNTAKHG